MQMPRLADSTVNFEKVPILNVSSSQSDVALKNLLSQNRENGG